ncbi:hypothetical protein TNCV_638431 [Trichonephila clavipes]|nr:hypothetical protein TNCV_638431 [Trichonephila clavipes]
MDIMIVQFRNEKVSNHGFIPITIDSNFVAFIVFEEGFHQPIKRTKHNRKAICYGPRNLKPLSSYKDGFPMTVPSPFSTHADMWT